MSRRRGQKGGDDDEDFSWLTHLGGGTSTGYSRAQEAEWARWRQEQEERERHRLQQAQMDQALIDSEADPNIRRQKRRERQYNCGPDGFVALSRIPLWSAFCTGLVGRQNGTTVSRSKVPRTLPPITASADDGSGDKEAAKKTHAEDEYSRYRSFGGGDDLNLTVADVARRKPVNRRFNDLVSIFRGDITTLEVDGIVNAANDTLQGGGGIDGAIHSAAGPLLVQECRTLNGATTGETKLTRGYNLPADYVLHTVGPIGRGDRQLRSCYRSCLALVEKHRLRSVAFCCVSTGIFSFPLDRSVHIAASEVRAWLETLEDAKKASTTATGTTSSSSSAPTTASSSSSPSYTIDDLDRIVFCVFREVELEAYERILPSYFPISIGDIVADKEQLLAETVEKSSVTASVSSSSTSEAVTTTESSAPSGTMTATAAPTTSPEASNGTTYPSVELSAALGEGWDDDYNRDDARKPYDYGGGGSTMTTETGRPASNGGGGGNGGESSSRRGDTWGERSGGHRRW